MPTVKIQVHCTSTFMNQLTACVEDACDIHIIIIVN